MSDNFEDDDEQLDVRWSDPRLMGLCSICNGAPCKAENIYWGSCPICHDDDGYINLVNDRGTGASHYKICEAHKTCWSFGANLLSSWMDETPEEREDSRKRLQQYRRVDCYLGFIDVAAEERDQQRRDEAAEENSNPDTLDE